MSRLATSSIGLDPAIGDCQHSAYSGLQSHLRLEYPGRRARDLYQERPGLSGRAIEASAGSFGRKGAEFEYGGARDSLDYFLTANYVDDNGWAEHNPSTVQQLFGKMGWHDALTVLDTSITVADNTCRNADAAAELFRQYPSGLYFPDQTRTSSLPAPFLLIELSPAT